MQGVIKERKGQAMLIAVLTLGGLMLGATTIAGFLTLYELRAGTDVQNSAKAIFAADSGIEWALYYYFNPPPGANVVLANGTTVSIVCYDASGAALPNCNSVGTPPASAISTGVSLNAQRAFFLDFSASSSSYP